MGYDIIGDIHGHALTLQTLLEKLGYSRESGIFQHPERKVIFLGDFIDTGPFQRQTLEIVRPMVEQGHAMAVMGNHEFNALAYSTRRVESSSVVRLKKSVISMRALTALGLARISGCLVRLCNTRLILSWARLLLRGCYLARQFLHLHGV